MKEWRASLFSRYVKCCVAVRTPQQCQVLQGSKDHDGEEGRNECQRPTVCRVLSVSPRTVQCAPQQGLPELILQVVLNEIPGREDTVYNFINIF